LRLTFGAPRDCGSRCGCARWRNRRFLGAALAREGDRSLWWAFGRDARGGWRRLPLGLGACRRLRAGCALEGRALRVAPTCFDFELVARGQAAVAAFRLPDLLR
jgi:hypothetical protein